MSNSTARNNIISNEADGSCHNNTKIYNNTFQIHNMGLTFYNDQLINSPSAIAVSITKNKLSYR
jgi:hypothetical protein